jgi:hypothetical protein
MDPGVYGELLLIKLQNWYFVLRAKRVANNIHIVDKNYILTPTVISTDISCYIQYILLGLGGSTNILLNIS